jgi:hypothetical protein
MFWDVGLFSYVIYLCIDLLNGTVSSSGYTLNYGIIIKELIGKNGYGDRCTEFQSLYRYFPGGNKKNFEMIAINRNTTFVTPIILCQKS